MGLHVTESAATNPADSPPPLVASASGTRSLLARLPFGPIAILAVAATFRFWNLLGLPLFVDESLWLRWATNPYQYLPRGAGPLDVLRVSLIGDVNPPLLHWMLLVVLPWVDQPVLAARAVAATFGLLAVLGTYLLASELFDKRVGVVASLVHAVLPLAVFFDRIIHYDALTAACVVHVAWLSARLARQPSVGAGLILGIVLAAAIIANPRGATIAPAPALALLLLRGRRSLRESLPSFGLAYLTAALLTPLSFVGVSFQQVIDKILPFALAPDEVAGTPMDLWAANLARLSTWMEAYVGMDLLRLAVLGVIVMLAWRPGAGLYILLLWLALVLPFILGGRLIFSRYLAVSAFPPSVAIGALTVAAFWAPGAILRRLGARSPTATVSSGLVLTVVVLVLALRPAVLTSIDMVTDPLHTRLPDSDRAQYQSGWYSGVGVPDAAQYLIAVADSQPIILLREDGMPGSGVHFYSYRVPNIRHEIEPALAFNRDNSTQRVRRWLDESPNVYFVAAEDLSDQQPSRSRRLDQALRAFPDIQRVAQYPSPDGKSQVSIFKVEPRG
jgi:hypothetical protein